MKLRSLHLAILLFWVSAPTTWASGRFEYEDLVDLIQTRRLSSVEAVLAELPASLKKNYALIHHSQSLQKSTPLNPRVLLHDEDARIVLSFNGDPSLNGFSTIEVMQYREATAQFEFRRIEFSPDGRGAVAFLPKNPAICLNCHGANPRPNWEPYRAWPTAYGSSDDRVPEGTGEKEALRKFIAEARLHPRYRYLQGLERWITSDPLQRIPFRPNATLSQKLSDLNSRKIALQIRQSPDYGRFKYAIAGALLGCDRIDTFLPESVRSGHFPELSVVNAKTLEDFKRSPNDLVTYNLPRSPSLRYLFEGRGFSIREWTLSFRRTYDFMNPPGSGLVLILKYLAMLDPQAVPPQLKFSEDGFSNITAVAEPPTWVKSACGELAQKSLAAFR